MCKKHQIIIPILFVLVFENGIGKEITTRYFNFISYICMHIQAMIKTTKQIGKVSLYCVLILKYK